MYEAKFDEANRPVCYQCELPGGITTPLTKWLNVDGAYEPFHRDCVEEFLDSIPVADDTPTPPWGWVNRGGL